jgi:hypothetical protein
MRRGRKLPSVFINHSTKKGRIRMHSILVHMAPVFSRKHIKGGERVLFKVMTKKGKVRLEGAGTIRYNYGEPTIIIDLDDQTIGVGFVTIKATDVMNGRTSLEVLGFA